MPRFKPRYLQLPDRLFKQLLSNATENAHPTIRCLDAKEKLHFIRSTTEITNQLYYKDLQRQLWNQYADISPKDDHWESTITKTYARQHHTSRMYRPKKSFIEHRRKKIEEQIKQLCEELNNNLDQLKEKITQWQPAIDFVAITTIIDECAKKGQQRLRNLFDFKKTMIKLAWQDHLCLIQFYRTNPNADVFHPAKQI